MWCRTTYSNCRSDPDNVDAYVIFYSDYPGFRLVPIGDVTVTIADDD